MEWLSLIIKKLVKDVPILPFMVGSCLYGLGKICFPGKEIAFCLMGFGISGILDYRRRNNEMHFENCQQEAEKIQFDDALRSQRIISRYSANKGIWYEIHTKDFVVYGLIFRHVAAWKGCPFKTIAGPLCPNCEKPVTYDGFSYWRLSVKHRYVCPCGFKKLIKSDPKSLYLQARNFS
jgi:hypothetical protein